MDEENTLKIVDVVGFDSNARAVPSTSKCSDEDRPLLKLMKIVMHIVTKEEKTVLTNCHLLDILQKEFDIDTGGKTELEIDIYLNVLKKFLKLWPRWDEFEKIIKESRMDRKKTLDSILADECEGLQKYLDRILKMTEGQMAPVLEKLEKSNLKQQMQEEEKEKDVEEGEVVLEVLCSRAQLNELVYTHPVKDTIFHMSDGSNPRNLKVFSLNEMLNWPNISISISLPWLECFRQNSSHIERLLKNLKLPAANMEPENLTKEIYWRNHQDKKRAVKKVCLVNFFNDLIEYIRLTKINLNRQRIMETLSQFKHDLIRGPDLIALGAEYQFFLNRYKYFRHLRKEPPRCDESESRIVVNGIEEASFDLRLEETISPAQKFQITSLKCDQGSNSYPQLTEWDLKNFWDTNNNWLTIECISCDIKFRGFLTWHYLQQHFMQNHIFETDWTCQNCKSVYTMQYLADNRWFHKCVSAPRG